MVSRVILNGDIPMFTELLKLGHKRAPKSLDHSGGGLLNCGLRISDCRFGLAPPGQVRRGALALPSETRLLNLLVDKVVR